jgi:hypothetical protein
MEERRLFVEAMRRRDVQVLDLLTELRRERPMWGTRTLLAYLAPRWPDVGFPAARTRPRAG